MSELLLKLTLMDNGCCAGLGGAFFPGLGEEGWEPGRGGGGRFPMYQRYTKIGFCVDLNEVQ